MVGFSCFLLPGPKEQCSTAAAGGSTGRTEQLQQNAHQYHQGGKLTVVEGESKGGRKGREGKGREGKEREGGKGRREREGNLHAAIQLTPTCAMNIHSIILFLTTLWIEDDSHKWSCRWIGDLNLPSTISWSAPLKLIFKLSSLSLPHVAQVFLQHPHVEETKQNQDYVIGCMTDALHTIASLADGEDPDTIKSRHDRGHSVPAGVAVHLENIEASSLYPLHL